MTRSDQIRSYSLVTSSDRAWAIVALICAELVFLSSAVLILESPFAFSLRAVMVSICVLGIVGVPIAMRSALSLSLIMSPNGLRICSQRVPKRSLSWDQVCEIEVISGKTRGDGASTDRAVVITALVAQGSASSRSPISRMLSSRRQEVTFTMQGNEAEMNAIVHSLRQYAPSSVVWRDSER